MFKRIPKHGAMNPRRKKMGGRPLKQEADRIAPWRSSPEAATNDQTFKRRKRYK